MAPLKPDGELRLPLPQHRRLLAGTHRLTAAPTPPAWAAREPLPRKRVEELEPGTEFSLRDYWSIVRVRRGVILWAVAAALSVAAVLNYVQVPTYRSSVTLRIDREEPNIAQFSNDQQRLPEQPDYIETQYRILKSRSLARRVITKLRLDERVEFRGGEAKQRAAQTAGEFDKRPTERRPPPTVVDAFLERLVVDPSKGTRLVSVSFESVDPELAPTAVNTLAEEYIEHNLETKWKSAGNASSWLQQQLSSLKAALEHSEGELRKYAAEHSILFVEERKDLTTEKLAQLEQQLTQAEADRIQKQSLAILVRDSMQRGGTLPGHLDSRSYEALRAQRDDLARQRSELLVTFGPRFPKVRRVEQQLGQLAKSIESERDRILSGVEEGFLLAEKRERLLSQAVARQKSVVHRTGEDFIQYNILKREAETNRALYDGLLQRLKEAGVSAGLRASNIAVLDPAETPQDIYRPRKLMNMLLALTGGLLVGIVLAFLQEHFDTAVRTPEEVERMTGLNLLTVVPRVPDVHALNQPRPRTAVAPNLHRLVTPGDACLPPEASDISSLENGELHAAAGEAYRSLRSAILLGTGAPARRILVTSSQPEEGKTTVSLNLARGLAQLGRRVLVVDGDMRRPNCAKQLGIWSSKGLSDYLQGLAELDELILKTPIDGLSILPAGGTPSLASGLVHSPRMAALLEQAARHYEHVIVDSPPSLVLSDALTLSRLVEGVILVVSATTERAALLRTKQTLDRAGVRFLGFVMNAVDVSHPSYGHYRGYDYAGEYTGETAA